MAEQRKLAAILAADVVGYSRLTGADEDRTLARLRALRSDLFDPTISIHHGRVVKRTGDGILVEFRSVVDAVRCAIEVQNGLVERNAGLPSEKRIEFRVGIHLGDVVEEADGDLMGDGVNIAARLEGIAKPGTIYLSDDAYRQVRSRLDMAVSDLGETQLKNIALPMRVFALEVGLPAQPKPARARTRRLPFVPLVVGLAALIVIVAAAGWLFTRDQNPSPPTGGERARAEPAGEVAEAKPLSIVVLPFNNIGDAANDYFADAITEELTTALAKLRDSFVIARNTAMTYKGKPVDVKQIGKDLGVRYVLEGSAQRGGDRVRVTAQLIDAETGAHLWADQFDQSRAEMLDMLEAIVTRLGRALDLKLNDADIARTARLKSGNLDAADLAMRCRSGFEQFFTEAPELQEAYGLCEKSLGLDPKNVTALGILGWRAIEPVVMLRSADPVSDIARADELVSRAFAVDPNDFTAHYDKAWIAAAQGRFDEEEVEASRSIASNPSYVTAYIPKCYANNYLGRAQKAIECADTALRLSPRDPFANFLYLQKGFGQLQLDRYADAVDSLRSALSLTPNDPATKDQLAYNIIAGVAAGQSADRDAAIREANALADQSLAVSQTDYFARLAKAQVLIQQNKLTDAIEVMAPIPSGIRLLYFVYHAECDAKVHLGRAEDAIECADRMIALGPNYQNLHVAYLDKGWALLLRYKHDAAIEALRQAVAIRPTASFPKAFLAVALANTSQDAAAKDMLKQYLDCQGVRMKTVAAWKTYWDQWPTTNVVVLDFRKRFLDGLRKAGMPEG